MARESRWIPAFAGMTRAGQACRLSTNRRSDEMNYRRLVIPAQAGIQCLDADEAERPLVIPAQAGIQCLDADGVRKSLDSRFRGNDEGGTVASIECRSAQSPASEFMR
jgi:hypothetical protein